jgi:D-alanyl-D-alanine carboxypeptidase/D-alanyl-D-alanine-endopeptidase (penicillin-binding protein 4)
MCGALARLSGLAVVAAILGLVMLAVPAAAHTQSMPKRSGTPLVVTMPQALPTPLATAWRDSRLPDDTLSLVVQPLDGGPLLFSIAPNVPRNPASVMKLVTTWASLSTLGPHYTWRTEFLAEPGTHVDPRGALQGPLYLRAGGDPQLMFENLWTLLRELRFQGIKQINDVVVDRFVFGNVAIDPAAFDGMPERPYNASPDAWMVGYGAMRVAFMPDPDGRRWVPAIDPPVPGVRIEGQVAWVDDICSGSPSVDIDPFITAQGVMLRLSGQAAGACGAFNVYRLVLAQTDLAEAIFRLLWKEVGGTFTGRMRAGMTPPDAVPLASHQSPTLAEIIRVINKQSNNLMARTLLLTLGAERGTRPSTVATSGAVVSRILAAQGIDMPELVVDNGAGLSRNGQVSARGVAAILSTAWRSSFMPEYMSSLAISGVDGTVSTRMREGSAQGIAHLKTGTLRDASALAGYVLGASGRRYVIVSLVNHEQAASARAFNDSLVTWLAEQ